MDADDRAAVVATLAMVAELYGKTLSSAHIALFCDSVNDLKSEDVVGSLQALSRTSRFFPVPADVREIVEGNVDDRAAFAWTQVASGRTGDEISDEVVQRMGGQVAVNALKYRHSHPDAVSVFEVAAKRKEFMQLYRALARRAEVERPVLGPLLRKALGDGG